MLFKSATVTSASGSIGGMTASHNRFGLYFRARRVPVNTNTSGQQKIRTAFGSAAAGWRALTAPQRAAWKAYADATTTTNRLGDTVKLTGAQWYTATLSLQNQFDLTPVEDAPLTPGKLNLGNPSPVIDASSSSITVGDIATDEGVWVGVYLGDPVSPGVSFYAGPYQLVGDADVVGAGLSLTGVAGRNGLPFVAGQRIPWRMAGVDPDGSRKLTTVASGIVVVQA